MINTFQVFNYDKIPPHNRELNNLSHIYDKYLPYNMIGGYLPYNMIILTFHVNTDKYLPYATMITIPIHIMDDKVTFHRHIDKYPSMIAL